MPDIFDPPPKLADTPALETFTKWMTRTVDVLNNLDLGAAPLVAFNNLFADAEFKTKANSTGAEIMYTFTVPGGTLAVGDRIELFAMGQFAANANTKTVRLKKDGDIVVSNDVTAAPNNQEFAIHGFFSMKADAGGWPLGEMVVGAVTQTTNNRVLALGAWDSDVVVAIEAQIPVALASQIFFRGFWVDHIKAVIP